MKDGLKFSDGTPLTAEDVAFTLTLLHDPTYSGATDISQTAIKGGQAYKEGKRILLREFKSLIRKQLRLRLKR